jgi:hypothetical protein
LPVTYSVSLSDSYGDGWNGNILAFRQGGNITKFGDQFKSGKSYGPLNVDFAIDVKVDIIVSKLGTSTNECGIIIRNNKGFIVFQRNAGAKFYANTIAGTFIP